MKTDLWNERLRQFKEQERPETVLVVAGNSELTRVVTAWMGIKTSRKKRVSPCERQDDDTVWRWLWKNTNIPEDWFYSRIAGSGERAARNFAVLVANHVLYPDGTVNGFVERYLREKVLSLFRMSRKNKSAA